MEKQNRKQQITGYKSVNWNEFLIACFILNLLKRSLSDSLRMTATVDRKKERQTDRQEGGRADGQIDKQIDTQADSHCTDSQTLFYEHILSC